MINIKQNGKSQRTFKLHDGFNNYRNLDFFGPFTEVLEQHDQFLKERKIKAIWSYNLIRKRKNKYFLC